MRLIYICDVCQRYIGEINVSSWNESLLGFDILSVEDKNDLLHLDWEKEVGTVMAICDSCWINASQAEEEINNQSGEFH